MAQTLIAPATTAQTETVIRWLKDENLKGFGGFYVNRAIIRRAARESRMLVLTFGRKVIGFAVFGRNCIDIFEILPQYREQGYGRHFAEQLIQRLFAQGSTELNVDCVPNESQHFWRALGFVDVDEQYRSWGRVLLILREPMPNNSFKADGFAAAQLKH